MLQKKGEKKTKDQTLRRIMMKEEAGGRTAPLLNWRNPFLLLDPFLDPIDGICRLDVDFDLLSCESLHLDHHPPPEPQDQVKGRLLLDVVVCKSAAVLQLLPSKYQSLLVWRDALLVLIIQRVEVEGVKS